LNPWIKEPELVDEWEFSKIKKGFHSWNSMSPELEFCNVAGYVVETLPDYARIIETGTGQGYVTRRVMAAMNANTHTFNTYDHDVKWLDLIIWDHLPMVDVTAQPGQPSLYDMKDADFVILDSETLRRLDELRMWLKHGKKGSLLLIHDTFHHRPGFNDTTKLIRRNRLQGWFLPNPRGSFLGVHP
jgi:hypothetical protein